MNEPFLESRHNALSEKVRQFGERHLRASGRDESEPEARTRELVPEFARAALLDYAVPAPHGRMDLRSLVTVREGLAYFSSLADSAFAMQGLGSYPVAIAGTDAQKTRWLPAVVRGEVICAFAVTEPEAGSDLAGVRTRAARDGAAWRLDGLKTYISNAGLANLYTVLARTSDEAGTRGLSMFLVDGGAPGLQVRPLEPMAAHPIGEVKLDGVPALLIGEQGRGYPLALATLDNFRPSVGAAACGMAMRAMDEAVRWSLARRQFGQPLSDFQAIQMAIADMHVEIAGARLLVKHAAWTRDMGAERIAREGAVAKLAATEMAQRVIDRAVQIHGGAGVMRGATVERLYREIRALRIYEGTTEVQKLVIARSILKESK